MELANDAFYGASTAYEEIKLSLEAMSIQLNALMEGKIKETGLKSTEPLNEPIKEEDDEEKLDGKKTRRPMINTYNAPSAPNVTKGLKKTRRHMINNHSAPAASYRMPIGSSAVRCQCLRCLSAAP